MELIIIFLTIGLFVFSTLLTKYHPTNRIKLAALIINSFGIVFCMNAIYALVFKTNQFEWSKLIPVILATVIIFRGIKYLVLNPR